MLNIELDCLKSLTYFAKNMLKFAKINILKKFIIKLLMLFNNEGLQKLILFLKLDKLLEININFCMPTLLNNIKSLIINSFKMFILSNLKFFKQPNSIFDTLLLYLLK